MLNSVSFLSAYPCRKTLCCRGRFARLKQNEPDIIYNVSTGNFNNYTDALVLYAALGGAFVGYVCMYM